MPANLSTIITRLEKDGAFAAHRGEAHATRVAEILGPRLAPLLPEGEAAPDLVAFQLTLSRLVDHERAQLVELDNTHVAELTDDRDNRRQRDTAYDDLDDQLSAIQDAWNGIYVDGATARLFDGVELLPQDPVALHRLGQRVHQRLTSAGFAEPAPRLAGQSLNRQPLTTELEDRVERLGAALKGVSRELKDSDESLRDKRQAIADFRRTLRFAGRCLAGLYGLAGLDDLVEKVLPKRPASRRAGGEAPEGEAPEGEAPEGEAPEDEAPEGEDRGDATAPPDEGPASSGEEPEGGAPSEDQPSGPLGIAR